MEVWNSFHVCGDNIYEWKASLPSGHPFTIIINCLANQTLFRMAWILIHDGRVSSVRDFDKHVALVVTGDDNAVGLDDYAQKVFGQVQVAEAMSQLGMVYTDSQKKEDFEPFKDANQISFLKRGFRFEKLLGRTVGPLSLDTILEMPMWTKRGPEQRDITIQKIEQALHELALHDDTVFNKWSAVICACSENAISYSPIHRDKYTLLQEIEEWGGSQKELGRYRMQYGLSAGEMSL